MESGSLPEYRLALRLEREDSEKPVRSIKQDQTQKNYPLTHRDSAPLDSTLPHDQQQTNSPVSPPSPFLPTTR
ncbi:hypothetical protein VTJ04DRAFT_5180 [Mycothermus thermophilus]|uniref:uncharacterized protein n=1 Tax=Humicola insolens TaxID=85995 RepID=UPI0037438F94